MTDQQIINISKQNNLEPAAVKAVIMVESGGSGFDSHNLPKILFEGHIFWNQLIHVGINPKSISKGNEDILYFKWTKDYYKLDQWIRLNRARKIHEDSALNSTSWGLFQIMGFNHKMCGYDTVKQYTDDMYKSEDLQLQAFINFIKNDCKGNKYKALQNKDWKLFAQLYNGPEYAKNHYDTKLAENYNKYLNLNK